METGAITNKELGFMEELMESEEASYQKFKMFAETAQEPAVKKLCEQLADRSREHFGALYNLLQNQ